MSSHLRQSIGPIVVSIILGLALPASAADGARAWSKKVVGTFYLYPNDDNFLQPTFLADRGRLHVEARYNYEDRYSISAFAGASFEVGDEVSLTVTPMIGALLGRSDGIVPAAEVSLAWRKFEAYAEAEWVLGPDSGSSDYFYMWSEASLWATGWLRAGVVSQRTRAYDSEREVEPGFLAGTRLGKLDVTAYMFPAGGEPSYMLLSIGFEF